MDNGLGHDLDAWGYDPDSWGHDPSNGWGHDPDNGGEDVPVNRFDWFYSVIRSYRRAMPRGISEDEVKICREEQFQYPSMCNIVSPLCLGMQNNLLSTSPFRPWVRLSLNTYEHRETVATDYWKQISMLTMR